MSLTTSRPNSSNDPEHTDGRSGAGSEVKYSILHRTTFRYGQAAWDNVNEVRLCPLSTPNQGLDFFILKVVPAIRLRRYTDLFSNPVHHFELNPRHHQLVVEARSHVSVRRFLDYEHLPYGSPHCDLSTLRMRDECWEFLNDSTYVQRAPEIWREALSGLVPQ